MMDWIVELLMTHRVIDDFIHKGRSYLTLLAILSPVSKKSANSRETFLLGFRTIDFVTQVRSSFSLKNTHEAGGVESNTGDNKFNLIQVQVLSVIFETSLLIFKRTFILIFFKHLV